MGKRDGATNRENQRSNTDGRKQAKRQRAAEKTCYTPRRQGSNRTGKTERRNRNRDAATGGAKPERHRGQSDGLIINGNGENNRRDAIERRNRKTPEKAGARKIRSSNNRERAQARGTDLLQKTAKEKPGAQNEAAKSEYAVTPKRQRDKRNNETAGLEKPDSRDRGDATRGTQQSGRMGHFQKSQNRGTQRGNATE